MRRKFRYHKSQSSFSSGECKFSTAFIRSPLPTPRETPSEIHGTSLTTSDVNSVTPARQIPHRDPSTISPTLPSASTNGSLQTSSLAPYNMVNGMPPFTQYPSQMTPMFNGATPQQIMAASTMPQQLMSNFMAQQMMANMSMMMQSSGMPFNPETFSAAVSDAISKYTSSSQPTFSQPARSESPDPEPVLPYPDVPPRLSDKRSSRIPSWPISVSSVTQRSRSQSSDTPSTQISADKKGKSRADTPSAKRRKLSTASYQDGATNYINASGSNGVASPKKVFRTKSGQELAFFVQIDMHNRFNLVDTIKVVGSFSQVICRHLIPTFSRKMVGELKRSKNSLIMRFCTLAINKANNRRPLKDC